MPSFVQIDENNIVINVITATRRFIKSGVVGDPKFWLEITPHGETRKRHPSPQYIYDPELDDFFPPKPYPSWVWTYDAKLNAEYWAAPIPFPGTPENGWSGWWDEATLQWIENPPGHFDYDLDRWVPDD